METRRILNWPTTKAEGLARTFEGLRLKAYRCPAGVPTIGYGHTKGVKMGDTCTEDEANAMLKEDMEAVRAQLDQHIRGTPVTESQAAALMDFVFNVGIGNFARSTMCKKIKMGNASGAADEFTKWVYSNGKKLPGLVKRREEEQYVYNHPY